VTDEKGRHQIKVIPYRRSIARKLGSDCFQGNRGAEDIILGITERKFTSMRDGMVTSSALTVSLPQPWKEERESRMLLACEARP